MWIVCVLFVICIGLSLTRGDFHKEYFSKNQMLPIRGRPSENLIREANN